MRPRQKEVLEVVGRSRGERTKRIKEENNQRSNLICFEVSSNDGASRESVYFWRGAAPNELIWTCVYLLANRERRNQRRS